VRKIENKNKREKSKKPKAYVFNIFLTRERFYSNMSYPGYSSIFTRIRQEAGLEALKLARRMEKTTYKLEAHHRHLHFRSTQRQF